MRELRQLDPSKIAIGLKDLCDQIFFEFVEVSVREI